MDLKFLFCEYINDTKDNRSKSLENCYARLSRIICMDIETISKGELTDILLYEVLYPDGFYTFYKVVDEVKSGFTSQEEWINSVKNNYLIEKYKNQDINILLCGHKKIFDVIIGQDDINYPMGGLSFIAENDCLNYEPINF